MRTGRRRDSMSSKFLTDLIKVRSVDTFRSKPDLSMENDMVRVVLYMPRWLWRRNCKYLNVDEKGNGNEEKT